MINNAIRWAAALLLALAPTAFAQEYAGQTIATVQFQGLVRVGEQQARAQLETQPGQPYNPRAVSRDIRRLFDTGRFASVKADVQPGPNGLILTYTVEENRFIEEVRLLGNKKVKDRAIRGVMTWREGDTFVAEQYNDERDALLKLYKSKGFPNASVDIIVEEIGPSRVRLTYSITEGRKARIRHVEFAGNEAMTDRQLRRVMKTKRAWWFIGGRYDEAKFEDDLAKIVDAYGDRGRLEAEIENTEFEYKPDGKGVNIKIYLAEGPEYRVESLDIAGATVFDEDEIMNIIEVKAGDVHNKSQVQKDSETLQQGYSDSGYVDARATAQVTLDRDKKTTHIVHRIDEQSLKYIREIKIAGNTITKDEVIRRQMLLQPGDRFDGAALRLSQRALENLEYFEPPVRLTIEDIDSAYYSNLLVDVEEGKTGNFGFGAGYSTDEGIGGFASLTLRNFDIANFPKFTGGGQMLNARLQIGDRRTQYYLGFTDPEFMGYPFSFGFDVFDERYRYKGGRDFTQENQGVQLRGGKALSPFVRTSLTLRYNEQDISGIETIGWPTLQAERGGSTTISAIWGIVRNTQDHPRDATRGSRHALNLEVAGLGGDNHFYKAEHDSIWYYPFGKGEKWIGSIRTREGWADEYGSSEFVPIGDRFFAGGTTTVRGYDQGDIGPKEKRFLYFGDEESIGGELRIVQNLEMKYKLTDEFRFYTFLDAGGVWRTTSDFDIGDMKFGAGIGVGVDVPRLGPIRLDWGIPLNPDDDQGSGRIHIIAGRWF